jgi:protein involved in polysaccharide export with SLBB domain
MYYLQGPTTLTQILADAGGFRGEVGPTLEVRRQELEDGIDVQRIYTFSTEKVTQGEEGGDFAIVEGDVLSVSARQMFFVTGEIASSGQFEITIGMTLMQAVTTAGGLGKFASQEVELHREVDGEKQILEFNYARIRKGKDEDPPIRSGDVIIVKRRFF